MMVNLNYIELFRLGVGRSHLRHIIERLLPRETHPTITDMGWIRTHKLEVCAAMLKPRRHQKGPPYNVHYDGVYVCVCERADARVYTSPGLTPDIFSNTFRTRDLHQQETFV